MGDRSQYALLSRGDSFAAEYAAIEHISSFPSEPGADAITAGPSIFFATRRGSEFAGLYQYAGVNRDDIRMDAVEVSGHVPRYISGNVRNLAAHHQQGVVAVLTNSERGSLYFYNYYIAGQKLVQNAWWKAVFHDAEIYHMEFIDDALMLFIKHTSGFYIEKITFKSGLVDTGLTYLNHLDRKFTGTGGTYNSGNNTTPIAVPSGYKFQTDAPFQVVETDGSIKTISSLEGDPNYIIHVEGNLQGKTMLVGEKYTFKYKFSEQLLREGDPPRPISEGRMTLRYGTLLYEDTGFFKVTVTPGIKNTYEYKLGNVVGVSSIGDTTVTDGKLKYPIHSKASDVTIEVTNDTPLPTRLTGAEFEFSWVSRSRRLA